MPPKLFNFSWEEHLACVYRPKFEDFGGYFKPIKALQAPTKLIGLENEMSALTHNTKALIQGSRASHALLWGARGCGKSSCLQYVLNSLLAFDSPLRVVEIAKESLSLLPILQDALRELPYKFVIVCDDLSFNAFEEGYKGLKSLLEGSLEAKAQNIAFYTTSNYRHLIIESYPQDTLHMNDMQDEILSLSDRFGLTLGFYTLGQAEFLAFLQTLFKKPLSEALKLQAVQFSTRKGSYNPRIAHEFYTLCQNAIVQDENG